MKVEIDFNFMMAANIPSYSSLWNKAKDHYDPTEKVRVSIETKNGKMTGEITLERLAFKILNEELKRIKKYDVQTLMNVVCESKHFRANQESLITSMSALEMISDLKKHN